MAKTFFDAIRQGKIQRVNDTIRAAEYNRLVDIETRNAAASRLSSDCLLYTSPSPRDATLSRMPSSA